jgi:hypothetical protein
LIDNVVFPADLVRKRLSEIPPGHVERVPIGPTELHFEKVSGGVKVWPDIRPAVLSDDGQGTTSTWAFLGISARLERDELVVSYAPPLSEASFGSRANGNGTTNGAEPGGVVVAPSATSSAQVAGDQPDVTLFVACYNEEANIERTLDTVFAALAESP